MNWIKVNDKDENTLPPLGKIVWIVYKSGYDDGPVVQLGGRDLTGDEEWLWGTCDTACFARSWENDSKLRGIEFDDDYRVTHWTEIEWPED